MISKEYLRQAYRKGLVKITDSPNGDGAVCAIGNNWFYFGGLTAEENTAASYVKVVPEEDIVKEIYDVLDDFRTNGCEEQSDEYAYYEAYLNEQMPEGKTYLKFQDIKPFTRKGSYEVNMGLEFLVNQIKQWEEEDGLKLNPDFQRGHVWTTEQQQRFIEFILRGGNTGRTLYFNDPSWLMYRDRNDGTYNEFVCVDGLQRITAIRRFIGNDLKVFDQYYRDFEDKTDIIHHSMIVNVNNLQTRAEVLQWYIDLNAGGTPHSEEEIKRIREMLKREEEKNG